MRPEKGRGAVDLALVGRRNCMLGLPASTTYGVLSTRARVSNEKDDLTPHYDRQRGFDVCGPIRSEPK